MSSPSDVDKIDTEPIWLKAFDETIAPMKSFPLGFNADKINDVLCDISQDHILNRIRAQLHSEIKEGTGKGITIFRFKMPLELADFARKRLSRELISIFPNRVYDSESALRTRRPLNEPLESDKYIIKF